MALVAIFIAINLILIFTQTLGGELRFCYNGPQRIRYEDCPGGFISRKTVSTNCLFYFQGEGEGMPSMKASYSGNVCDHRSYNKLEQTTDEFDNTDLQFIRFYKVVNSNNESMAGEDARPDMCNETCLGDYLEPKYWDPVPHLVDKPTRKDNASFEQDQKEYVELTKLIMIKIINEDELEEESDGTGKVLEEEKMGPENSSEFVIPSVPDAEMKVKTNWTGGKADFLYENTDVSHSPMSSLLKLLAKSMRVTYKKCMPFLEPSFYTLVFRSMQEFRRMAEFFPNIHVVSMKRILKILDECEMGDNSQFLLNGSTCEDKRVVKFITNLDGNTTRKHILSPKSFRWGVYDPIIEAAWSSVQFVHGHCFPHFRKDVLHLSLFVRAMDELFLQPLIERHWTSPAVVGKGLTLWEMAYDTGDIQNQMHNLDACVSAAYEGSLFKERLERPFTSEEALVETKFEDIAETPKPGWTKSPGEYWNMYENKGFEQMVEQLGICVKDPEQFSQMGKEFIGSICTHVI